MKVPRISRYDVLVLVGPKHHKDYSTKGGLWLPDPASGSDYEDPSIRGVGRQEYDVKKLPGSAGAESGQRAKTRRG